MSDDYVCPICLNVMIEPVTLPCNHGLCKSCLETTLREAAMQCPICRYRLSTWARRNRKKGTLVNEEKWNRIKNLFTNYVEQKLSGNSSVELTEAEEILIHPNHFHEAPRPPIAAPGDIRREYERALEQLSSEVADEQRASLDLIRQLEVEEQEQSSQRQLALQQDAEVARQIQAKEAATTASMVTSTPSSSSTASSASRRAEKQRASWLDRFILEKQRLSASSHSNARAGSADSIGPELGRQQFRPIETFPLSPSKPAAPSGAFPRDPPLRPRVLPSEASKENVCRSPPLSHRLRTANGAAVTGSGGGSAALRKQRSDRRVLATSEGTAFRPVTANRRRTPATPLKKKKKMRKDRSILEYAFYRQPAGDGLRQDRPPEAEADDDDDDDQVSADMKLARELQRRFDVEYQMHMTAQRYVGDEDAYMFRERLQRKGNAQRE